MVLKSGYAGVKLIFFIIIVILMAHIFIVAFKYIVTFMVQQKSDNITLKVLKYLNND